MERGLGVLAPPGHRRTGRASAIPTSIVARKQPERFAQRSRILTDISLSEGARLLYLFLDDQARGQSKLYAKQLRLSVMIGISTREFRRRLGELESAEYLTVRRSMTGNSYDFHRTAESDSYRTAESARSGPLGPVANKERARKDIPQEIPPLPPASGAAR